MTLPTLGEWAEWLHSGRLPRPIQLCNMKPRRLCLDANLAWRLTAFDDFPVQVLVRFSIVLFPRSRSLSSFSFSFSRSGENENDYENENENEPDLGFFGCGCRAVIDSG